MITFSQMGYHGQLGNQLFQYATLLGIAVRRGHEIILPDRFTGKKKKGLIELGCFKITVNTLKPANIHPTHKYIEHPTDHSFDPQIWNQPDGTDFAGYFQNEKYFTAVENLVREELQFKDQFAEYAEGYVSCLPRPLTAVHVRRGDSLQNPHIFHILSRDWYIEAAQHLPPNYLVVSDDIPWCRENLSCLGNVGFCETPSYVHDLAVMTKCDAHIISQSSFGWWGAWLSGSKQVVAPDPWFPVTAHLTNPDALAKGWKKLEVSC